MPQFSRLQLFYHTNILSTPLCNAEEVVFYLKQIWDTELINIQEQCYQLCLNGNNEVICWRPITTGCNNRLMVDVKLATACAVGCLATKVIIAHNHPSAALRPSAADIAFTHDLEQIFHLMDIELADHLIINMSGYYSFADNGMLKAP
jgi:DNA repair protein RadC